MLKLISGFILVSFSCVCSGAEIANTSVQNSVIQNSTIAGTASDWHLSDVEWANYRELMNGRAGKYYTNLTPPEVLGMMADNDQDLHHFAKIFAQLEHEKIDLELRFDKAFHDEAKKMYSDEPIVKPFDIGRYSPNYHKSEQHQLLSSGDHIALFVDFKNQSNSYQMSTLINRLKSTQGTVLDIYLVNIREDQDIQQWARDNQIPIDYVLTKRITLNHGDEKLLKKDQQISFPYALLVRGGRSQIVNMETL